MPLSILVDSGSSHNFLDPKAAKQIGSKLVLTKKLMVTIADGSQTSSTAICPDFEWTIQGETFNTSMRILPLGSYQMILGVKRLKEIGHVTLDLNQLTLTVKKEGRLVTLQGGMNTSGELQVINGGSLFNLCAGHECNFIGHLNFVSNEKPLPQQVPECINELL